MSDAEQVPRTERILARLKEITEEAPEVTVTRDRYGYRINGEFYRRVTTMLRGIPKPWLGSWAAKMVAEFAVEELETVTKLVGNAKTTDAIKLLKGAPWSKRDDAGDRGTAVHNSIEAYVLGEDLPDDLTYDERACAEQAMAFLDERGGTVLASELTVFNPSVGYAGTLDLWSMDEDGSLGIDDWKTSKSIYAEHAVQQIAYRHAEFAVVQKKPVEGKDEAWTGKMIPWGMIMADRLNIIHVTPEHALQHPINLEHDADLWRIFRAACLIKTWQSDVDDYRGKTPKIQLYADPINLNNGDDDEQN